MKKAAQSYIPGPLHSLLGGYAGTVVALSHGDADIHILGSTPEAAALVYGILTGEAPDMTLSREVILISRAATYQCTRLADKELTPKEATQAAYPLAHWWKTVGRDLLRHKPGL